MSEASLHQQLEWEKKNTGELAARLENLRMALNQAGKSEAADDVREAESLAYDVYEAVINALKHFP